MLRLADGGAAVVYIASELEELLAIADRIAVLSRGRVAGLLSASEATGEQIGRLMLACSDDGPGQDVGGVHASVVR
jgi:simple sugar transport system ATP-binding protein